MKMCLTIPVRGTPENVTRMYRNLEDTHYDGDILWGFDDDDPQLEELIDVTPTGDFIIGPRARFVGTLNSLARLTQDHYDVVTMGGSDHAPRTKNFDKKIEDALQDNYMAYGNDLLQGENLATFCFTRTDLIKEVGYFVTPGAKHLYVDNMLMDLGKELNGLVFVPDVIIEHLHPCASKTEWTALYELNNSPETYNHDKEQYDLWKLSLPDLVARLRAAGF